ncbi:hypothetical protein [Helicobacter felis]|uniref:Uncharacterized protein n=1 Tax=Helicobacter felis (strain ATCC 49179 / CCUG 28539 / NCTC 12436 / CS1) TaxID=936155 RepID=E7ABC3_HELFC|nr:hypothetical protein [Helicobacter felis]CBY83681.1 putative uncharacterized protein [Helicobacter felis ATCC 49179]
MDFFKIGQDAGTLWVELYTKTHQLTALQKSAMLIYYHLTNGYRLLYTSHTQADKEQTAQTIANTLQPLTAQNMSEKHLSLEVLKIWARDPQREEEIAEYPILPARPFRNTPHYSTLKEINALPADELHTLLKTALEFASNLDPSKI